MREHFVEKDNERPRDWNETDVTETEFSCNPKTQKFDCTLIIVCAVDTSSKHSLVVAMVGDAETGFRMNK
jgi:hypothetical protein